MRARSRPETPDGGCAVLDAETSDFCARSGKTRICAEAYSRTPHKKIRSLTPRLPKSAVSGRELARISHRVSTAAADLPASAALFSIRRPQRTVSTPPAPHRSDDRTDRHLCDLATKPGEISVLGVCRGWMADGFRRAVKCPSRRIRGAVLRVRAENPTKKGLHGARKTPLILFPTGS